MKPKLVALFLFSVAVLAGGVVAYAALDASGLPDRCGVAGAPMCPAPRATWFR